eukprot:scaffold842_cov227-Pinguiococcus_pyrenoidosus.AAC.10
MMISSWMARSSRIPMRHEYQSTENQQERHKIRRAESARRPFASIFLLPVRGPSISASRLASAPRVCKSGSWCASKTLPSSTLKMS